MVWWRDGFRFDLRITPSGFLIALIYALACWATRQLSLDQFYLPAGVRVAALLLCPPRLWPYLFLGEWAYFAQMRYPLIEKYGWVWAVVASATLMPAVALIIELHRRWIGTKADVVIVSIAALAALTVTALNASLSQLLWSTPPSIPFWTRFIRYSIGDFVGILSIAPLALLWIRRQTDPRWFLKSTLVTCLCIAALLGAGLAERHSSSEFPASQASLYLIMTAPVVALTCIHGWRGAALGVPLLNLIIGATASSVDRFSFDPGTFTAQQIMAVAGVSLLVLGYRISHLHQQYGSHDSIQRDTVIQIRSSHIASEMELRGRVLRMRRMGESIDHSMSEIAHWLRRKHHNALADDVLRISVANSRQFRTQTSMMFPTSLEHVGLYVALYVGGVSEAWCDSGRVVEPTLLGDPCQLSIGLQLAAYRSLTETVSLLIENEEGRVKVRTRSGRVGLRRGILMSIGLTAPSRPPSTSTMRLAMDHLAGRALGYNGVVQCRRNRNRILLVDDISSTHATGATWRHM